MKRKTSNTQGSLEKRKKEEKNDIQTNQTEITQDFFQVTLWSLVISQLTPSPNYFVCSRVCRIWKAAVDKLWQYALELHLVQPNSLNLKYTDLYPLLRRTTNIRVLVLLDFTVSSGLMKQILKSLPHLQQFVAVHSTFSKNALKCINEYLVIMI
jgi:hypothetical protein